MSNPTISAIVACYRDEEAIPVMYERCSKVLKDLTEDYEIIFVNDCSPDNSWEVICTLAEADSHVLGISHSRNFGSQMAFQSGLRASKMESAVLMDGDLQDPPEVIPELLNQFRKGFDVVYGVRSRRQMGAVRNFFHRAFYKFYSALSDFPVPRDAGDFALLSRRVVDEMLRFSEREVFLRSLRAYIGFRQTGVEYYRPERMFGRSTNNLLKNIEWAKSAVFSSSTWPLRFLTWIGLLVFALSLISGLALAINRIVNPAEAAEGITLLAVIALFFGGLNLLAIGVIGEYVGKVLAEVKNRPGPIIEQTVGVN